MPVNRIQAAQVFSAHGAPRVMTPAAIKNWLIAHLLPMSDSSLDRFIATMTDSGLFKRVNKRLLLNYMANPPPVPDEAAGSIRDGARISLQRALGLYGVSNNPSNIITCIVPIYPSEPPPKLGMVQTEAGTYHFRGVPLHVCSNARPSEILQSYDRPIPGSANISTPEQALVEWLYLAKSPRSDMSEPPVEDIDLSMLNMKRFKMLADAAGIKDYAEWWVAKAKNNQNQDWDAKANRMGLAV